MIELPGNLNEESCDDRSSFDGGFTDTPSFNYF